MDRDCDGLGVQRTIAASQYDSMRDYTRLTTGKTKLTIIGRVES